MIEKQLANSTQADTELAKRTTKGMDRHRQGKEKRELVKRLNEKEAPEKPQEPRSHKARQGSIGITRTRTQKKQGGAMRKEEEECAI